MMHGCHIFSPFLFPVQHFEFTLVAQRVVPVLFIYNRDPRLFQIEIIFDVVQGRR